MKTCLTCKVDQSEESFAWRKRGVVRHNKCRSCQSLASKAHYEANKSKYIVKAADRRQAYLYETRVQLRMYFETHPCIDCGNDDLRVLHLDHRDPNTKLLAIADMIRSQYSSVRIAEEIAKCDVRCANCHAIRTAQQFGWWRNAFVD